MGQNLETFRNVTTLTNSLQMAISMNMKFKENDPVGEDMLMETLMHALSCAYELPKTVESESAQKNSVKGPIILSCGLQVLVSSFYEKEWSLPRLDPLLTYRHTWRRRNMDKSSAIKSFIEPSMAIWSPCLPPHAKNML